MSGRAPCRVGVSPSAVPMPPNTPNHSPVRPPTRRGRPFGDEPWVDQTAERLGRTHTLRREGRPQKGESVQKCKNYLLPCLMLRYD